MPTLRRAVIGPPPLAYELVEDLIRAAAEAATKAATARAAEARRRHRPARARLTLRPGLETPLWNELVRQIQYHVGRGEVPEAESLYDQLIELTKQDEIKAKKAKLVAEWATANDEHKKARAFLLDEWRKATVLGEYQPLFAKLQPTMDTLVKQADKLGLRNLMSGIGIAYARLQDQLAPLDINTEADQTLIKEIKAFADEVRKIEQAAEAELKKLDEKK